MYTSNTSLIRNYIKPIIGKLKLNEVTSRSLEAIILFATMLRECAAGKLIGDYYVSRDRRTTYLEIDIPDDYRINGVVEPLIHKYHPDYRLQTIQKCSQSQAIFRVCKKYRPYRPPRLCLHELSGIMALSQRRGCHHGEITASA